MTLKHKLILNGTDNNDKRHRYSFEKNERFKIIFPKFMERLGFEKENIEKRFTSGKETDEEEIVINFKVSNIKDEYWHFQNKKYEVDVFFGIKKIITIIKRKRKQNRNNLIDGLITTAKWIPEEEIKKRIKKLELKNNSSYDS